MSGHRILVVLAEVEPYVQKAVQSKFIFDIKILFQEIKIMNKEEMNAFYTRLVDVKMKQNCIIC